MPNLDVILEGKGPVTLRDSNYVAAGGEGTVYKIGDSVVKLYHEPKVARQRGMADKVRLLTKLKHPYVAAPTGLVVNAKGDPIGHYLPFVDGHPLARMFTNDFWQQEGFTAAHASTLVDRMRDVVSFAHQNHALLVDANELNWLASFTKKSAPEPHVIDVDSWAVGKWPATVIMPSIRDWNAKDFNEKTDWFAWGVVTFQVYTGLHPYKGTLDGFQRSDLMGRMKANASVFAPGVKLNRAVRDFSSIPGRLLSWYEATFAQGERTAPPSPLDTSVAAPKAARVVRMVTTGGGALVLEKLFGVVGDPVERVFHCGVALLTSGKLVDLQSKRSIGQVQSHNCAVVKVEGGWLVAQMDSSRAVDLAYVQDGSLAWRKLDLQIAGHQLMSQENRLFVATEQGLTELKVTLLGKPVASVGRTWGVLPNSTKWFQGVAVMDAMGAKFVVTPFGDSAVGQVRVRELDDLRIVSAKAGNRFVAIIGLDKKGDYHKVELTFDKDYKSYQVWVGDTDGPELNLAILPRGVCATIVRDGELDIYVPTNGNLKKVNDSQVATDMLLSNWGDRVIGVQSGDVWSIRTQ